MSTIEEDIAKAVTLSQAVHLAIGNASTHWDSLVGTGIYQEDRARSVSEALIKRIEAGSEKAEEKYSDPEGDSPDSDYEDTTDRRRQALAVAIGILRERAPQEDRSHPITIDFELLTRMRDELGDKPVENALAREVVATMAEEDPESRVLRAFGNGYVEGLRRGSYKQFDHS